MLCLEPKSLTETREYLGYKERKSARRIVRARLNERRIAITIPDEPTRGNQEYVTVK